MATKYTQVERFYRLGSNCHYCSAPLDKHDPMRAKTRDHKTPLSRGGANTPSNVVDCCWLCNHTKGNMTEEEYREWVRRGRPKKSEYLREIGLPR